MAAAADCSMPGVFAKDYLERIMKKTEKKLSCVSFMSHKNLC